MDDRVTIPIEDETRKRLRGWKSEYNMTYDQAINELLDEVEQND